MSELPLYITPKHSMLLRGTGVEWARTLGRSSTLESPGGGGGIPFSAAASLAVSRDGVFVGGHIGGFAAGAGGREAFVVDGVDGGGLEVGGGNELGVVVVYRGKG